MRFEAWHNELLRTDPAYAAAVAEVEADPREHYADQVLALRIRAGLTQAQLAKLAGTTQAVVSRLEAAVGNPKLGTIAKVLRALEERITAVDGAIAEVVVEPASQWSIDLAPNCVTNVVIAGAPLAESGESQWALFTAPDSAKPPGHSSAANADYALAA